MNFFNAFYYTIELFFKSVLTIFNDFSSFIYSIFFIITFLIIISVFLKGTPFTKKFSGDESWLNDGIDIAVRAFVIGFLSFCIVVVYNTIHPSLFNTTYIETNETIDPTKMPVVGQITTEKPFLMTKDIDFTLTPIAKYHISGIVVAKNTNLLDDKRYKKLGPIDIGLIFGKLAEPENRHALDFSSFDRGLRPVIKSNISWDVACHYLSHNHLIPANDNILRASFSLENGQTATFDGYLVTVNSSIGDWGHNDMIPTGECKPICQIIYLTEIRIGKRIYR